jgi:hypothetical protein
MTRSGPWLASAALIALTIGITSRVDLPTETQRPLPPGSFTVAAGDTAAEAGQTEQSGANLGATSERDTSKIDQPARRNPTTDNGPGDSSGSPQ